MLEIIFYKLTLALSSFIRVRPAQVHNEKNASENIKDTSFTMWVAICEAVAEWKEGEADDKVCYPLDIIMVIRLTGTCWKTYSSATKR